MLQLHELSKAVDNCELSLEQTFYIGGFIKSKELRNHEKEWIEGNNLKASFTLFLQSWKSLLCNLAFHAFACVFVSAVLCVPFWCSMQILFVKLNKLLKKVHSALDYFFKQPANLFCFIFPLPFAETGRSIFLPVFLHLFQFGSTNW